MHLASRPASIRAQNRRLAAILVVIGLLMQAVAPYLPMPAMDQRMAGVENTGFIPGLPICLSPATSPAEKQSPGLPHPGDCAACVVMAQASAALVPNAVAFVPPASEGTASTAPAPQRPVRDSSPAAFSSRAPPVLA